MQKAGGPQNVRIALRSRVTCPHCWAGFGPEDALWVAEHPDLQHDPRLDAAGLRFLPTRFDVDGNAIDPMGSVCKELACPKCHLRVPRPLFEIPPLFLSIAGTPSCGKTYFLASMCWRLRNTLPRHFSMAFTDADPVSNLPLHEYENQQFFNSNPDEIVKLLKTDPKSGDLYNMVMYGEQQVTYPRPFLFAIRPSEKHPNYRDASRISRLLCLYDNAGESFAPGTDTSAAPVTQHLAQAQVLLYCFDPTQDPRLRAECRARTKDPQVVAGLETRRQEAVLHEIVDRVRRHAGLHQNQKHSRPLVVVVTKYDVWWPLLGEERLPEPWVKAGNQDLFALDMALVTATSDRVREMLWRFSPELVSAAESFTDHVLYVPVSATGCAPESVVENGVTTLVGIRPRDINPMWTEVPLLVALARWGGGMIPYRDKPAAAPGAVANGSNGDGTQPPTRNVEFGEA